MKFFLIITLFISSFTSFSQSELDSIMINQINNLRKNPKSYIPLVEKYIYSQKKVVRLISNSQVVAISAHTGNMDKYNNIVSEKSYSGIDVINIKIKTAEELINVLKNTEPLNKLTYNHNMNLITDSHGSFLDSTNTIGHFGPNGERVYQRFEKTKKIVTENVIKMSITEYQNKDISKVILDLLIDSFIETRGHRKNLLDPDKKYISVYISEKVCVQNFGE